MTYKSQYEEWRKLFQTEKKGKGPEDVLYRPVPEIKMAPYVDRKIKSAPSFTRSHLPFSHSFLVDSSSTIWLSELSSKLKQYQINKIFCAAEIPFNQVFEKLQNISAHGRKVYKPEIEGGPIVLNFASEDILVRLKHFFSEWKNEPQELWIMPGEDFLWNIALYRGIQKKLTSLSVKESSSVEISIYFPLQKRILTPNESQLIPMSNQFLSMMISGINHCIWDVRNASDWQISHLRYLLNVPEILEREGKILTSEDPIGGSDFFEELSDQVVGYLHE